MQKINFTIDNRTISVDRHMTILKAALLNNIYIPHLCFQSELDPVGVCRLCMVEIAGRGLVISCRTPVEEGLIVTTKNEQIDKMRCIITELLIINNLNSDDSKDRGKTNELIHIAEYVGVNKERLSRLRAP